jgi:uncharacterized membrane protein
MLARLWMLWTRARDSLWFLPGVLTLLATALAFVVTHVERNDMVPWVVEKSFFFGGGVEGARGVLNAIAGGLITVTGVVFSVTIVALQLASSQFTPRVLRNFTADRGNQLVLGVFIATFTYTLLILRTIRTGGSDEEPFIPRLGVTIAVVLVLVSIGFLIFFINHAARSIQVSFILDRVARRTLGDVYRLFPERIGRATEGHPPDPRRPDEDSAPVCAAESGYLQAVDTNTLFQMGERKRMVIGMEPYIGDFVLAGQPLARVSPPQAVDEEVVGTVRTAFVLGPERTPEQDVEFGIIEISDIALKALSPGINDPTTAFRCIDRLAEILLAMGTREPPRARRTREGHVHYIARYTSFERAVGLAFDQIRHFGASNPALAKKLLEAVTRLAGLVPPHRRAPLDAQAEAVLRSVRSIAEEPADRAAVEEAAGRLRG